MGICHYRNNILTSSPCFLKTFYNVSTDLPSSLEILSHTLCISFGDRIILLIPLRTIILKFTHIGTFKIASFFVFLNNILFDREGGWEAPQVYSWFCAQGSVVGQYLNPLYHFSGP